MKKTQYMNLLFMKQLTAVVLVFLFGMQFLQAQKTVYHNTIETEFRTASELFEKEKYGAAKNKFTNVVKRIGNPHSEMSATASFYAAVAAVRLANNDSEALLNAFLGLYPEHAKANLAHFYLGVFLHGKNSYGRALRAFQEVDSRKLNSEQLAEYHFKRGYCFFMRDDYEEAAKAFHVIKDVETDYTPAANYYYGHIAYSRNNWETAHQSFMRLREDRLFGALVPYYIVHIYFMQERFQELLKEAPPLLEQTEESRVPEIARLIGESYYQKGNYAKALHYFGIYKEKGSPVLSREEKYQLGFAHYRVGNCEKAIKFLTDITGTADELTQNANYILGDCYLKTGEKRFALNAFQSAVRDNFNDAIHQSALLNYAKLSYKLSFNPYNDAVVALMTYIDTYPDADDIDEANSLLVNVFFATKNYRAALESIENITFKTTELKSAYQQIAYLRGLELFNNRDFANAVKHFEKSSAYVLNPRIAAQALYWKAEALYRMEHFKEAAKTYNAFLLSQGAFQLPEYNLANYNLAYAYFKQKEYNRAVTSFRKFLSGVQNADPKVINDAYVRVGDSYFITKRYNKAIDFYDRAIHNNAAEADYAMFQKAICYGVLAQFDAKSQTLQTLISDFPNSTYLVDAKYELGNNKLAIGNNKEALKHFNDIINNHASSIYKVHAMLKAGLVHFNEDNYEKALSILKKVVEDYPATPESKDALVSIRDIYVNINRPDEFFVYVRNISFADVSRAEQDSLTYIAVQNQYMAGDCDKAIRGFSNYLEKFPDGSFVIDAEFYRAQCYYRKGEKEAALRGYSFVLSKHRTKFTESALVKAAEINFKNNNYSKALKHYIELEKLADIRTNIIKAQVGQMRSHFKTDNFAEAIEAAQKVVRQQRIDDILIQEARLIMGNSHLKNQKISHAQAEFLAVTRMAHNELKAEAKYKMALIQYQLGNFKESEKLVFKLINEMPSYDYWIAKSFILLADNLVAMGNTFQARHTLESIIDNYDGMDLVQIAFEKLNAIKEKERHQEQQSKDTIFDIIHY